MLLLNNRLTIVHLITVPAFPLSSAANCYDDNNYDENKNNDGCEECPPISFNYLLDVKLVSRFRICNHRIWNMEYYL